MRRFTIDRDELLRAIGMAILAVPTKTTLPSLAGLLFDACDGKATIVGTNLDMAIAVTVPAEVLHNCRVILPARTLRELVKELPQGGVQFTVTLGDKVEVVSGHGEFNLQGLPSDEFPSAPSCDFSGGHTLAARDVMALTSRTAFAASDNEDRPILNGILVQASPGQLRFVATSGIVLASASVPTVGREAAKAEMIIPPKALAVVSKVFAVSDELAIGTGECYVALESPAATITTRLIEGPYPNYNQVIPQDNDKSVIANRERLAAVLRRVDAVANSDTHCVVCTLTPESMNVSVSGELFGGSENLSVDYDGPPFEIGFNAELLLEALDRMPTEDVLLKFKAPDRAATVEPVEWNAAGSYLILVMPLRIIGQHAIEGIAGVTGVVEE